MALLMNRKQNIFVETLSISFQKLDQALINFLNFRIYGMVDFNQVRQYFVRDPEAFKLIAIKGFDHFEDRREFLDENIDELWGASLVSLRGNKWRETRAALSAAFTGSKMRQMFDLVAECAD